MRRILFVLPLLFVAAPALASPGRTVVRIDAPAAQRPELLIRAARSLEKAPGVHDVTIDCARGEVRAELSGTEETALLTAIRESGLTGRESRTQVVAVSLR